MIKVKDLIATLQARHPEAQVYLMTQRKQPFENRLAGVVARDEMLDQYWRVEPGVAADDVFLVVGKRLRPGSLSAWIVAERREAIRGIPLAALPPLAAAELHASADAELPDEMLAQVVREHLGVDRDMQDLEARTFAVHFDELRNALRAAYRAGQGLRGGTPAQVVATQAPDPELADDDGEWE